ncbi:UbiA prenyltransferase family [Suillus paluster]|uniref:UbiA prenyltransferase family n=1 Tax=Suillus paluster TaxID=48578 RepID=UPI001B86B744|nr:UbiA prenyltransferase family [Suillus paluster]KAG1731805.1 UbiA prenyltransferase family [Suillus paluster]
MTFATVVSPRHNLLALSCSLCWLWFHLFQFNQSYSVHEDVMNKSWRPVPSGRISVKDSRTLRWGLLIFCLGLSSLFSSNVFITSVVATVLMMAPDDFNLSCHPIFKSLCNIGFYMTFELGSSLVMCSIKALYSSALDILLTVHAQDFADVNGDRNSGRRTLPIVAPEGSRIYMICVLPLLSFALASFWSLGPLQRMAHGRPYFAS